MKKYRYVMDGMFEGTDGETYEINAPSHKSYDTEKEAMEDEWFAYRFLWDEKAKEPILVVFEEEGSEIVEKDGQYYIKQWVEGEILKTYTFGEFQKNGGFLRVLKPEAKKRGFIDGESDFEDTNKTFAEIFPSMKKDKLYYVDSEAYFIESKEPFVYEVEA